MPFDDIDPAPETVQGCRYCDDSGLSIIAGGDQTLSICNLCSAGLRLQGFLRLLAKLPPEKHQEVVEEIQKRVVEL